MRGFYLYVWAFIEVSKGYLVGIWKELGRFRIF